MAKRLTKAEKEAAHACQQAEARQQAWREYQYAVRTEGTPQLLRTCNTIRNDYDLDAWEELQDLSMLLADHRYGAVITPSLIRVLDEYGDIIEDYPVAGRASQLIELIYYRRH